MSMSKKALTLSIMTAITLAGCAKSPKSQFYVMNPAPKQSLKPISSCRKIVVLKNIDTAKYLNKPNIVTRLSPNQLRVSEFYRWAEPLDDNIKRVIHENLNRQLKSVSVLTTPLRVRPDVNYNLTVDINKFDMNRHGKTTLDAMWRIYDNKQKLIFSKKRVYVAHAQEPITYACIVNSMNKTLTSLSRDIGYSINNLSCKKDTSEQSERR